MGARETALDALIACRKDGAWSNGALKDFISRYFDNSFSSLVCFFVRENNLSMQELDELLEEIKKGSEK